MIKNNSQMGTLASKISDKKLYKNQNVVKVKTKENLNNSNFPFAKKFYEKKFKKMKIFIII